MISRLLPLLLLGVCLAAEDAPRQLDPAKPADAVQIVAQVAAQVPLRLAESQALLAALQTLQHLAEADARAKANPITQAPTAPVTESKKP